MGLEMVGERIEGGLDLPLEAQAGGHAIPQT
jgi:hypothetical protein